MKKELIFDVKFPYRNNFQIYAFRFGSGRPSAAIAGAMRGDEARRQFICSQVVKNLAGIERERCFSLIRSRRQVRMRLCTGSRNIQKRGGGRACMYGLENGTYALF